MITGTILAYPHDPDQDEWSDEGWIIIYFCSGSLRLLEGIESIGLCYLFLFFFHVVNPEGSVWEGATFGVTPATGSR